MLNFRYEFDSEGFYTGIARRGPLGLFPTNSTDLEPLWIPGTRPRWDFRLQRWDTIKRKDILQVKAESRVAIATYDRLAAERRRDLQAVNEVRRAVAGLQARADHDRKVYGRRQLNIQRELENVWIYLFSIEKMLIEMNKPKQTFFGRIIERIKNMI